MRTIRLIPVLALSLGVLASACGEDAPDSAGSAEIPPQEQEVLDASRINQDSTAAGAPSMTGTLRDSLNDGEAIPGVEQPQPDRPGR
jgi:hypothetical protein